MAHVVVVPTDPPGSTWEAVAGAFSARHDVRLTSLSDPRLEEWIDHADVHVTIVDRRHTASGHWLDSYPFVQLHQASLFYGVASTVLGATPATGRSTAVRGPARAAPLGGGAPGGPASRTASSPASIWVSAGRSGTGDDAFGGVRLARTCGLADVGPACRLAVAFLAVAFLVVAFRDGTFVTALFLAATFLAGVFLAAVFRGTAFCAACFLAGMAVS